MNGLPETLRGAREAFDEERARELRGHFMECRAMAALLEMYSAQKPHVRLPVQPSRETSKTAFSDADLVRAMRTYGDDIRRVAAFFNVSKGCIYNRLRGLPPGMIDGEEARIGTWPKEPAVE